jgi:hypothetical protein
MVTATYGRPTTKSRRSSDSSHPAQAVRGCLELSTPHECGSIRASTAIYSGGVGLAQNLKCNGPARSAIAHYRPGTGPVSRRVSCGGSSGPASRMAGRPVAGKVATIRAAARMVSRAAVRERRRGPTRWRMPHSEDEGMNLSAGDSTQKQSIVTRMVP